MVKIGTVESALATAPVYFDSALIAKFYVNEPGREAVRAVAKRAGIVVTSGIAVAEISAAFHRKLREGAVDQDVFKALRGAIRRHNPLLKSCWNCPRFEISRIETRDARPETAPTAGCPPDSFLQR